MYQYICTIPPRMKRLLLLLLLLFLVPVPLL